MPGETPADAEVFFDGPSHELEHDSAVEELHNLVMASPSVFGRLIQIGSFWTAHGRQSEAEVSAELRTPQMDQALHMLHKALFVGWLGLSLERKKADVSIFLGSVGKMKKLRKLPELGRISIPLDASTAECELFQHELAMIRSMIENNF